MASAALRWTVLSAALGATLVAVFYPLDPPTAPTRQRAARVSAAQTAQPVLVATSSALADRANVDPFAPRAWQAKPVEVAAVAVVVESPFVGPMPPPPPAPAPVLPFQYMGSFSDGGATVIYLSRGDQTLLARRGETLENSYKVLDISASKIDFLHLPTGEKQSMNLPAPSI